MPLNVQTEQCGGILRKHLVDVGSHWAGGFTAMSLATPVPCTHLTNVGYSSAFTRQIIWIAMVIPIRPTHMSMMFNQCRSGKEAQRGCGWWMGASFAELLREARARGVMLGLLELVGPGRLSYLTFSFWDKSTESQEIWGFDDDIFKKTLLCREKNGLFESQPGFLGCKMGIMTPSW